MDIPEDISAAEMYRELMEQIRGKGRCYLLLDEIQEVKGWERCVNSLLNHQAVHVTGIREKSLFFCHKIPKIPHFFVASIRLAGRKRDYNSALCSRKCIISSSLFSSAFRYEI